MLFGCKWTLLVLLLIVGHLLSLATCRKSDTGKELYSDGLILDSFRQMRPMAAAQPAAVRRQYQQQQQHQERKRERFGDGEIGGHLESMDDLEHVAYLTMRNFNITDEDLLQSSWLMNLGNAITHKQHQKAASLTVSDQRSRLALMLESFILHLRNGHLRRLQLDELEAIVATLNSTVVPVAIGEQASQATEVATGANLKQIYDNSAPLDRQQLQSHASNNNAADGTNNSWAMDSKRAEADSPSEVSHNETKIERTAHTERSTESRSNLPDKMTIDRCHYLVIIYKLELRERQKKLGQQQQSRIEYKSGQSSSLSQDSQQQERNSQQQQQPVRRLRSPLHSELKQPSDSSEGGQSAAAEAKAAAITSANSKSNSNTDNNNSNNSDDGGGGGELLNDADGADSNMANSNGGPDSARLMRLCQLAVKCHSADELVNLISGPWRTTSAGGGDDDGSGTVSVGTSSSGNPAMIVDHETRAKRWLASMAPPAGDEEEERGLGNNNKISAAHQEKMAGNRPRNLRDSLSLSLAKLCPLILFQLHDDDGMCTVRRDDRPSMITVWGFATLFVTIVSFCSLIGLSITPLLGPTATESSGSSDASDSLPSELGRFHHGQPHGHHHHHHRQHHHLRQAASMATAASRSDIASGAVSSGKNGAAGGPSRDHRTCLTLFEGLAVGSLVGSALFSLIPQAFELQERESNQGFLLKALIIFFGIYLFFLSERIMRIILDTRQQGKKKKRINHRSSNSVALPSTTADFDHHHNHQHHHHHHQHQYHQYQHHYYHPQQQQQLAETTSNSNNKQDISTVAWMIVLGDGLHNFIDGISIGAAFSESILSGVSISVAVICEEFPHELGDFAVLVSSGMTVRQALGYNFLSACTCYFGMAVGIILGDVNDGASYISALAAGVFLYIALVDMMGELSATLEETSRDSIAKTLKLLLLQNVGIFIGISIIFILSFIDF